MFLNLTLNAVEAMPNGGELRITTRVAKGPGRSQTNYVVIEFHDTGVGMPQEQADKAFASLLNTTKSKGTGLGLALVGRIVETHGGRVKIRSGENEGTSITIRLPLER